MLRQGKYRKLVREHYKFTEHLQTLDTSSALLIVECVGGIITLIPQILRVR